MANHEFKFKEWEEQLKCIEEDLKTGEEAYQNLIAFNNTITGITFRYPANDALIKLQKRAEALLQRW